MRYAKALLALGVVIGVALVGAGTVWFARPYIFHGSVIGPPVLASDFSLTDQNEKPFRLSAQAGQMVLLFFGYTNCPDECPATMAQFKRIRAELGREAERVQFVLVTVDPEVDTPGRLGEFVAKFDPTFIGLTGTRAELEPVWKSYGVYQAKQSSGEVAHNSRIYAIDARGNLRLTYTTDAPAAEIARDVQQLLRNR